MSAFCLRGDFMKLAEALNLRADLNKKIEQLRTRLAGNALVQEGEKPAENPEELFKELEDVSLKLKELITGINLTNSTVKTDDGMTITEIIAAKDTLIVKLSVYRTFLENANKKVDRYSVKEIKILPSADVRSLQKKADSMSRQIRELDNKLQQINWTVDLL